MIRSFADPQAERIWIGERSRQLPADMQDCALVRLKCSTARRALTTFAIHPAIGFTP